MPLKKSYIAGLAGTPGKFDLSVTNGRLTTESGLETSVINSIFTDRRALPDDILPQGQTSRRGWWRDPDLGSRLWLLEGANHTEPTRAAARQYVAESLEWMTASRVAERVDLQVQWVRRGVLGIGVTIIRPARPDSQFELTWDAQARGYR